VAPLKPAIGCLGERSAESGAEPRPQSHFAALLLLLLIVHLYSALSLIN